MNLIIIFLLATTAFLGTAVAYEYELDEHHDHGHHHHVRSSNRERELFFSTVDKTKIFTKYQGIYTTCCGADLSKCKCPVRTQNWFGGYSYPKKKWDESCKTTIFTKSSVGAYVQSNTNLSALSSLLKSANLLSTLSTNSTDSNNKGYTLFAPTNEAFAKISSITAGLTDEQIKKVLLYHVVSGTVKSSQLTTGSVPTLLTGQSIAVDVANGVTLNDNVKVTKADNLASNGVIHIIDSVLIPGTL